MNKVIDLENKYHMNTYGRLPVVFVKGDAQFLYDENGKEYLDFISGLGVTNLGHANKDVKNAVNNQLDKLEHVSNLFYTKPQTELAKKLVDLSIKDGKVFFANSGAESNEAAVKLVRLYAKNRGISKPEIITAKNSFHGRTLKMLAATGQPDKQKPFEPLPPGFTHVKFNDIDELKSAINDSTAAVMLEVIQGEGGVWPAEENYLEEVANLCKEKDMLLVLDEVQTGLGRTGKYFAYQHFGIKPDIVTVAKALGNGLPIGACIAKQEIASVFNQGDHGSTFGGGPVVCAAALEVLNTLEKENLVEKSKKVGKYLKKLTKEKLSEYIDEVRGCGLMLGLKLKKPIAAEVVNKALSSGLVINNIGDETIRFLPPLIIDENDCDKAISILKEVLENTK